jgi:hypothetical protein
MVKRIIKGKAKQTAKATAQQSKAKHSKAKFLQ